MCNLTLGTKTPESTEEILKERKKENISAAASANTKRTQVCRICFSFLLAHISQVVFLDSYTLAYKMQLH